MPGLVEQLHEAGKIPGARQCYTYVILAVLTEGEYEVANLNPVEAKYHFDPHGLCSSTNQESSLMALTSIARCRKFNRDEVCRTTNKTQLHGSRRQADGERRTGWSELCQFCRLMICT